MEFHNLFSFFYFPGRGGGTKWCRVANPREQDMNKYIFLHKEGPYKAQISTLMAYLSFDSWKW